MAVPSWVLDTNILVSAALSPTGNCDQIVRAAVDGRIRLAWSASMLAEYRAVLLRPKFRFSPEVVATLLSLFAHTDQVAPRDAAKLPDSDDEAFLGAAMATANKVLVTGNLAHFPVELCEPVQVLSPAQAVELLRCI